MMVLSWWELLDLAGSPRNPWGELRLIARLSLRRRLTIEIAAVKVVERVVAQAA
jgi:hypothetical protein